MLSPEQESMTRMQFTEKKFNHQAQKAYRKGKLLEVHYTNGAEITERLIVDPALVNFMYDMNPDSRDDHQHMIMLARMAPSRQKNPESCTRIFGLSRITDSFEEDHLFDVLQQCTMSEVYKTIIDSDPTPNKEYVQWILTMYTRILKDREPSTKIDSEENQLGGFAYLFFENLYKISDALKIFHRIKGSKLLTGEQKDIYTYKSVSNFIETVFSAESVTTTEINPNVLSFAELEQIKLNNAHIVYQDSDWIIVHTVNQEANKVFGEQTTWCTAGTRWTGMFDTYNIQGKLFVLIRNRAGASSHIKSNPENRLQFHFETNQYMNALDSGISIQNFFRENYGVKNFFRGHIINTVLRKSSKVEDMVKTLNKFAMVKELIPILKEMKTKELDLSGVIGVGNEFEMENIGEISTLEDLTIRDCELETVPDSIRCLTQLKALRLSGNKITRIPEWINELTELEVLNLMENDIQEPFDISKLSKLLEVHVGFNKKLRELPTGLRYLKMLMAVDASMCDIRSVSDEILECDSLVEFNVIRSKNLKDIPTQLVNLPKILYVGIDETGISPTRINYLNSIKTNELTVLA